MTIGHAFERLALWASMQCGRASTFMLALLIVMVWGASGPYFRYSDTWQLVINTGTTVVTFLMVFLLQNTQYRDNVAMQVKLDELIRVSAARNSLISIENMTSEQIEAMRAELATLSERWHGKR